MLKYVLIVELCIDSPQLSKPITYNNGNSNLYIVRLCIAQYCFLIFIIQRIIY